MSDWQVWILYSKVFFSWFEGFVEVWGWVKVLSKFENFYIRGPYRKFRFWPLFEQCHCWLVSELQVSKWYSKVTFCCFVPFVDVRGWVTICQKLKILMTAVLSEISDFYHFLNIVISDLWVNCKCQNNILKCFFVDLNYFLKFEVVWKFCQKLKDFMIAVVSEISDFDHFLNIVISDLWVNCKYQNCILKCFLVHLKDLRKFEVESKFCQWLKIFITAILTEISDFDHFLNIVISDLWVNFKCQNNILKCSFVVLNHFWKFVVESKFCQKLKMFMIAVLSEISDFDHFLNIVILDSWVNCKYEYCILKCSLVDVKDFWKFEVESKFCKKLKIFMTAVLSEISDFDHFLNIVISDLWVNCKYQNYILKCYFVHLNYLWKFEVESNFLKNWKFWWLWTWTKFQNLTTFWTLSFLTCELIASIKIVF